MSKSMHQRLFALSLATVTAVLAPACKESGNPGDASLKTDLVDNSSVVRAFAAYKTTNEHCRYVDGRKRVIVTGFGLFGDAFNISGIAAMSLSKKEFWPDSFDFTEAAPPSETQLAAFARHAELATTNGGLKRQRTLQIDGQSYEVCFLYLDVKWDLAAAIILYESSLFRPDLVVMSGMNGKQPTATFWESGALNNATLYNGFEPSGAESATNIPAGQNARILEDAPFDDKIALTWNAAGLAAENAALIASISGAEPYTSVVGEARSSNNYICNNVSYAVTAGLTGQTVKLAGEQIEIAGMNFGTKTGFLHYPSASSQAGTADDGAQLFGWTKVLANTIKFSLGQ